MKKKDREEVQLLLMDSIMEECSIQCNNCDEDDLAGSDIEEASEYFYDEGWRVDKDGYALCPKCNKKKKK